MRDEIARWSIGINGRACFSKRIYSREYERDTSDKHRRSRNSGPCGVRHDNRKRHEAIEYGPEQKRKREQQWRRETHGGSEITRSVGLRTGHPQIMSRVHEEGQRVPPFVDFVQQPRARLAESVARCSVVDGGSRTVIQRACGCRRTRCEPLVLVSFSKWGCDQSRWQIRTAPADGVITPLRFAFSSCQHWEQGHFTALDHMAREEIDLVAFLGDYFYEDGGATNQVRKHVGLEIRTLDDYRRRYALYKGDPALQAAHARCPWLVVWDDHEVDNNYAGLFGENGMESEEQMRTRRAAAYQAWWEHQPVRVPRAKSWADLTITRSINWGALARFWMLDTRQYRDDQACGDGAKKVPCGDWADPKRVLLGAVQEKWLVDGVGASKAAWQVLANQVMMAPYDSTVGPDTTVPMDQWSGYPVARDRLLKSLAERAANRTVVITGDIHSNWVNELSSDFSTRSSGDWRRICRHQHFLWWRWHRSLTRTCRGGTRRKSACEMAQPSAWICAVRGKAGIQKV